MQFLQSSKNSIYYVRENTGSRNKEHKVDALVPGAEEGRDKLRKATFRSTYPLRRGCPNGETRQIEGLSPLREFIA